MPRKLTSPLESVEYRLKLKPRRKPYNPITIAPGLRLACRRNARNACTWVALRADAKGGEQQVRIGSADDNERADGVHVMTYWQATEVARKLVRSSTEPGDDLATLESMFDGPYRKHLIATGKRVSNISRSRKHIPLAMLKKPIALVTTKELLALKQGLLTGGKLKQTSVRRIMKPILAAVKLAEGLDRRIQNGDEWRRILGGIDDNYDSRNVDVIPDADVHRFVAAAHAIEEAFGLFVEVLAHTGARPSQAARLLVRDLLYDPQTPRLHMPSSRKGRGQRKVTHQPVAISLELARKLKAASKGKPASALLLPKSDGTPWKEGDHDRQVKKVAVATGIDITIYVLRHCSIVRGLLAGVPIRIVAASHDTSTQQVERTYSKHILHYSDTVARQGLLGPPPANEDNVVALRP
jgi:integrase